MKLETLVVGVLQENCYILVKNNKVLIIDPGDDASYIDKYINNNLVGILVTHHHFDHVGALDFLKEKYHVLENSVSDPDFKFEIIDTPGHSSDSKTFYFKEINSMFVGDFIFKDGIGRCDLPTGNVNEMIESLNKMTKYNKDIIIYPGHGEASTLGMELKKYINY